nr:ribosomal L1 domain-containing protein CG13096-like [Ipomoea batatas]
MDAGGLGSEVAFALREIVVSSVLEAMVAEALSATVRSASCLLMMMECLLKNNDGLPELRWTDERGDEGDVFHRYLKVMVVVLDSDSQLVMDACGRRWMAMVGGDGGSRFADLV